MHDIQVIKESVKSLGRYSNNHIKVFCILADCSVDGKVFLSVKEIQEKTGMKRSSIYFALNTFQKDGLLLKDNTNLGSFIFQKDKIEYLKSLYKKKSNLNIV